MHKFPSLRATRRLRAVLAILVKYGFGEFVGKLRAPCRTPVCVLRRGRNLSIWTRIRMAVEDLGPTAIKIGQAVSTRPDLVPPELCAELTNLQESVYQEPFKAIAEVAEASLGTILDDIFADFEPTPVAAASLSQVHRARLRVNGDLVAVKIRRPGIMRTILADLELMDYLAVLADRNIPSLRKDRLPELVAETRKTILRELDFRNEARNITIFRSLFNENSTVYAPSVYPEYCTEEVLVMEFIEGVRIDAFTGSAERRRVIANAGLAGTADMMLRHGFFHADPHFGNIRIVTDEAGNDRLCFYDWGMVGRLTPDMRSALVDYIMAIVHRDPAQVARVALEMAIKAPPLIDFQKFQTDVMFVLEKIYAPMEASANLGRFLLDLTAMCRTWDIHLRSDYVLMARALISIEAAGRVIYPGFDVIEGLRPIATEYELRRRTLIFSDKPLFTDVRENIRDLTGLPKRLTRLMNLVEAGDLAAEIHIKDLERLVAYLNATGNRLAAAIISGALIIGSSLVFTSDIGPHWQGLPVFGLAGYTVSAIIGIAVILHMLIEYK